MNDREVRMPGVSPGLEFAWQVAAAETAHARHEFIEPVFFLIGVCSLEKTRAPELQRHLGLTGQTLAALLAEADALDALFARFGIEVTIRRKLRQRAGKGAFVDEERSSLRRSPASRAAIERAQELAADAPALMALHLLAALLEADDGPALQLLRERGVDTPALREAALEAANSVARPPSTPSRAASLLQRYGRDLTQLAREGEIHECIGRRDEMLQILRTLSRQSKNNPVLVGDAGVGKTAIVDGLAWRMASNKDAALASRRLIQLDVAELVAQTPYRGQFEQRMREILREVVASPDVIIFIDEIHTLLGAGRAGGALDAAQIVKPALARGELRCIGATTVEEYRRWITGDPALERRFRPITVREPTAAEAQEILRRGYQQRFQQRHGVAIDATALQAAVTLSARYLPDRRLPDKAIDLLEEACTRVRVPALSLPPGEEPTAGIVTAETIAEVLAQWTGIPVGQFVGDERTRLLGMADELKQRVIGQQKACEAVALAVQRARLGLAPDRPTGVFLFVGPTGVGKTELARATAGFLFGSEKAMVRLDMSEFIEKHTVSRLIGAPPGYVGYEEEGQLTGALRRTPFCVVLLDEVEKAHPDILNLFLQIFDAGRLSDARGRAVDARHALFIMTSNVGSSPDESPTREPIERAVQARFRPEFLNRLDAVIPFQPLRPEHIRAIVELQMQRWREVLAERDLQLMVADEAIAWLAERGYDARLGARPLLRLIDRELVYPIGGLLLAERMRPADAVRVSVEVDHLRIDITTADTIS
jgi:ATP-dependent Clp protease ATP-binding subunit ClpC